MNYKTYNLLASGNFFAEEPDKCPICSGGISPILLYGVYNKNLFSDQTTGYTLVFACPKCHNIFIAKYESGNQGKYTIHSISPQEPQKASFDDNIMSFSPSFIEVYNQALAAEAFHLDQIAGMGYRKALEFLIKDYAIYIDPTKEEDIKKTLLGKCIEKYIDHPKIKATATASAWLGNDETHYIRKFDNKDIEDLKRFINSCVYWILADYDANKAIEMTTK